MLRNRKSASRLRFLVLLTILPAIGGWVGAASDDVPMGYKAERYQPIWERNPFTIVTPVIQNAQPKVFDKFVLVSWLNDGGNDVVFVQNTETNEVQKVTKDPNASSLRVVAIHKAADPKDEDVVLSNGTEEGAVKFRLEAVTPSAPQAGAPQAVAPQAGQPQALPNTGVPIPVPGVQTPPLLEYPRQPQAPVNAQRIQRFGTQPGTQGQQDTAGQPPRASEVRRKRLTPPPVTEQPVGAPTPAQSIPVQPQTQ